MTKEKQQGLIILLVFIMITWLLLRVSKRDVKDAQIRHYDSLSQEEKELVDFAESVRFY